MSLIFKATETKFILTYPKSAKRTSNKKFKAPFPTPYSIFVGAKPTNKYLKTIENINKDYTKKHHSYFKLIQGILYSNLNYSIFNEKTDKANDYLNQLANIEKEEWANVKQFDTPEYAAIVLKTLNNEKTKDTLFALGSWDWNQSIIISKFYIQ